ncbi:signal peptidase I [Clostridium amazonitimonense]
MTDKIDDIGESNDNSQNENKFMKFFTEWILPIFLALIIAGLINKFLIFKVYIPSESMLPTLKVGDQLFVTKIYNTEKIEREDIIVFYSNELEDLLIKRVIGLPGDTVEIKDDGKVFVNGEELKEEYVKHQDDRGGKFKVPENKFFFLGDNRANSKDSRWWKDPFIDKSDIKGKAQVRVYPFDRVGMVR